MSDMTANTQPTPQKSTSSLYDETKRTKRRNQSEVRFKAYGVAAIAVGLFFLIALLVAIFSNGIPAFKQTFITIPVELTESALDKTGNRDVAEMSKVSTFGYKPVVTNALVTALKDAGIAIPFKNSCPPLWLPKCAIRFWPIPRSLVHRSSSAFWPPRGLMAISKAA